MKVKLLTETAKAPTRGSKGAAGLDLYADQAHSVLPKVVSVIHTGIAVKVPDGHVGLIRPRSGLAVRDGVQVMAGVIDADYTGEVLVALTGVIQKPIDINPGDRIAQLLIIPVSMEQSEVVDSLDDTERGSGGFGSTGR